VRSPRRDCVFWLLETQSSGSRASLVVLVTMYGNLFGLFSML
jgi:hypothetical protein